jgi:hypothetical protein
MIRPDAPIFKGGTKRGRNPLKLLGGAGKWRLGARRRIYASLRNGPRLAALEPVTPGPIALKLLASSLKGIDAQ